MKILEKIDAIPPCVCRVLARNKSGKRGLSTRDIANISGLSKTSVAQLSLKMTWKGQRVETIDAFAAACGVDLFSPWKVRKYLRTARKVHITRCHGMRKKLFQKLFKQAAGLDRKSALTPMASQPSAQAQPGIP